MNVVVEQIAVNNNIVEVFSYGPRSVRGVEVGGVCTFPPIQLNVFNNNTAISYAWAAAPDGTLALNAANTVGHVHLRERRREDADRHGHHGHGDGVEERHGELRRVGAAT